MILDCGETRESRIAKLEGWHGHFAWWPVLVDVVDGRRKCAWLETVERRGVLVWEDPYGQNGWHWHFRRKEAA